LGLLGEAVETIQVIRAEKEKLAKLSIPDPIGIDIEQWGVWTGSGQRQCTPSRHHVDHNLLIR